MTTAALILLGLTILFAVVAVSAFKMDGRTGTYTTGGR